MSVRPKLFRDPVHDIIAFRKDCPVERVLLRLIETPELQRLRRVRQLGLTHLVYQGAEHSRFVHSMGVASFARRIYDHLRPDGDALERLTVLAAALCHDLGHGPFSHVTERISGVHHEVVTTTLVRRPGTGVHQVLAEVDPDLPERVARLYEHRTPLHGIVSSQLDADRLDYILRDGLATGVKIGVFDVERILSMLEIRDDAVCVSFRAVEAVEGYLLARFHMYKQVYLHKASRAAERMLEAAIRRARELTADRYPFAWTPTGALDRLVRGVITDPADIAALDDHDVWFALKRWSEEPDPILRELADGLVHRHLYKTVPLPEGPEGEAREAAAAEVARSLGFDPRYQVLVDSSEDTPYSPYLPGAGQSDQAIRILMPDERLVPIEEVSDIVRLLGRVRYQVRRLVVPRRLAEALAGQPA